MWQDSDDADERCTDVPVDAHEPSDEQNLETSLNESEEERRSPLGPGASAAAADPLQRAAPSSYSQQRVPNGPPPGLPLLQQDDCLRSPATMKPVLESRADGDSDDEEEADDERHSSDEFEQNMRGIGPVPEGALRYSELPSIGSANHFSGNCDRCCFHPKGRCLNGFNCQHCHFDHEKRKRKNKKKNKSKQLSSLNGDDDLDDSAYGSSLPVSPDAPFIGGMLPQEYRDNDFPVSSPATPSGFLPQQPQYYAGLDAGARPSSAGASLGENKWFQTATGTAQQASPPGVLPAPMQDNSNFLSAPPPGYDFPGQLPGIPGQTLPGSPAENGYGVNQVEMDARYSGGEQLDRREEYIRQLEAENRYLRACLVQCLGPNATALSLLPPPPGGPPQQSFFRPAEGLSMPADEVDTAPLPFSQCPPPPPGVPAPMPPGAAIASGPVLAPTTSASQGLSPSAPPFWPAWQDPADLVDNARFDAPPHHPPSFEQVAVPHHQDADGQMLATTGQLLGGHP